MITKEGNEMDRIEWLKERLKEQPDRDREYFISYALGALRSEAEFFPDKTYTSGEVVAILQIIHDARFGS